MAERRPVRGDDMDVLLPVVARRLDALESRLDRLIGYVEGQHPQQAVSAILSDIQLRRRAAMVATGMRAQGHDLGPWTYPASGGAYALCRTCNQGLVLDQEGIAVVPHQARAVASYEPKSCQHCGRSFTPHHGRQVYCGVACRPSPVRRAG